MAVRPPGTREPARDPASEPPPRRWPCRYPSPERRLCDRREHTRPTFRARVVPGTHLVSGAKTCGQLLDRGGVGSCKDGCLMRPRDPLRRTFGSAAEGYDAARPSYPPQLFDDLVDVAAIEPGERLLEIGCGTGKATRPLLERGFSVVCIELGPQLAEQARRNLAGLPIEVHVAEFEEWPGQRETFDLV